MSCVETLSVLSNLFTIIGVIFALIIYFLWRRDYGIQHAHEYALTLLKKMKYLHLEIDLLRRAKFYNPKTITDDIEKIYIPQIEEKILKKVSEIQVDLFIAEESLVRNKKLQSKFNTTIIKNVISYINSEAYVFLYEKSSSSFDIKKSGLFKIIFPSESHAVNDKITRNTLGIEIINDEFNKIIQDNFASIYTDLEENLANNTFIKDIKKYLKSFFITIELKFNSKSRCSARKR